MEENVKNNPTPEQVRLIFKDTYNFYLKWKDIDNDEDWNLLVEEEHELYRKYPFDLCKVNLKEFLIIIKKYYEGG